MSKVAEKSLWQWLKRAKAQIDHLYLERVENRVGSGMPDVVGCYNGYGLFVELKTAAKPVRETTGIAIEIRDSQQEWHEAWFEARGASFFLVQVGKERFLLPWDTWRGRTANLDKIRELSLTGGSCGQREVILAMKGY